MTSIKVGDKIRSMDFPLMDQDFREGEVTAIVEGVSLVVKTSRHVVNGEEVEVSRENGNGRFVTPAPGEHMLDDSWKDRIVVTEESALQERV